MKHVYDFNAFSYYLEGVFSMSMYKYILTKNLLFLNSDSKRP